MPLTEDERNILLGAGVVTVTVLTAAAIIAAVQAIPEEAPAKHSISIQATKGGTTEPAPGFYTYDEATSITVTAIAFEGYEFKGWYLNGEYAGVQQALTLTVSGQNVLIASFEETGAPPLIPAYIRPVQNCVTEDWWKAWVIWKGFLVGDVLQLGHDFFNYGFVKFKICDAAGNGVPGQFLAVYTDPMPDVTDFGSLKFLDGLVHTRDNPLILQSDGDGVVTAGLGYEWFEPGCPTTGAYCFRDTIGRSGKIHWVRLPWINEGWTGPPVWHDLYYLPPADITEWERLLNPVYRNLNAVHCYWVDNPSLLVQGDAIADCMVKIMPSKNISA
ncbi:MAG: hypothetical protein Q8J76_01600 [Desulfobulbaceae bacterium]|nr:hypothetical protein [Desulfobulbaceae bacterium]